MSQRDVLPSITTEKMEEYKRGARERLKQEQRDLQQRRETAWEVARLAARVLKEQFGATRVVIFGSVVHGHWFRLDSDIDLAVEGISTDDFFHVWGKLDYVDARFEINLVNLEVAPDTLAREIEKTGVEI